MFFCTICMIGTKILSFGTTHFTIDVIFIAVFPVILLIYCEINFELCI